MICDTCKHNSEATIVDVDTNERKPDICLPKLLFFKTHLNEMEDCFFYEKK